MRHPRTLAAVVVLGSALALAGCAGGGSGPGPTASSDHDHAQDRPAVTAPVIVDLADLDGTTVDVGVGGVIDLTGDDETFTEWKLVRASDPTVVDFTPGTDDGSAQFNPAITGRMAGTTEIELENSATGEHVAFTVNVTD